MQEGVPAVARAAKLIESDDERKARQRGEVAAWAAEHPEYVPAFITHGGDKRGPEGGMTWDGLAHMARARQAAGVQLTERDHEALARCAP